MYVSDKHKIIWICVPGTGTRSFEKAAKEAEFDFVLAGKNKHPGTDIPMPLHFPASIAKEIIPVHKWATYEKIAFIRNPYDWMNSIYNHRSIKNIGFVAEKAPFADFVRRNNKTPYLWYVDDNNNMLIDTLYKTEELKKVFLRFGLKYFHINTTSFKKPKQIYTPELEGIMKKRFWREFKHYE